MILNADLVSLLQDSLTIVRESEDCDSHPKFIQWAEAAIIASNHSALTWHRATDDMLTVELENGRALCCVSNDTGWQLEIIDHEARTLAKKDFGSLLAAMSAAESFLAESAQSLRSDFDLLTAASHEVPNSKVINGGGGIPNLEVPFHGLTVFFGVLETLGVTVYANDEWIGEYDFTVSTAGIMPGTLAQLINQWLKNPQWKEAR